MRRGPRQQWTRCSIVPGPTNGRTLGVKAPSLPRAITCTILFLFCGDRSNTSRRVVYMF